MVFRAGGMIDDSTIIILDRIIRMFLLFHPSLRAVGSTSRKPGHRPYHSLSCRLYPPGASSILGSNRAESRPVRPMGWKPETKKEQEKNPGYPVHPVKLLEVNMYYTYVFQSEIDNGFYIGFSKDLKLRPALLNNASH